METLIVPVYLNQRMVFDLLAMLQGGISTVTAVTKSELQSNSNSGNIRASFGVTQALASLLKIDLSGEASANKSTSGENKVSEERIHTPTSLFYQLRNILIERELIKFLTPDVNPEPGDILEFQASLRRNPIVETMDSLSEMMNMAIVFGDNSQKPSGKKAGSKKTLGYKKTRTQMEAFSKTLKTGDTIDLTAQGMDSKHSAVVTIDSNYLNDPTMSDLVDGQFKIVGKVIRYIKDENESISLIRKTALSNMPTPLLKETFDKLSNLSTQTGIKIPELCWEIKGPAIQILPISIFA